MARFTGFKRTNRPGCLSYALATLLGLVLGALAGAGPGWSAGALLGLVLGGLAGTGPGWAGGGSSLNGPWNPLIRWLGPTAIGWFGTARQLAAFAGAAEFAFFGALIGATMACVLVAARVPLTLVTFGLSLLALTGVLVLLAVR